MSATNKLPFGVACDKSEVGNPGENDNLDNASLSVAPLQNMSQRSKDMFGDCALVEIIHLHDCLRGAIKSLQRDVNELAISAATCSENGNVSVLSDLERRVAGRFKVIWSVFQAHSAAEDEFIWPALKKKMSLSPQPRVQNNSGPYAASLPISKPEVQHTKDSSSDGDSQAIEPQEYEEDHINEEKMFSMMDELLTRIRKVVSSRRYSKASLSTSFDVESSIRILTDDLRTGVEGLSKHLFLHLQKEEDQCLPLVAKHLNNEEINELVGKIMGKRSSDTMCKILTMAIQILPSSEREDMVEHMKQAMVGTFFERWLAMEGLWSSPASEGQTERDRACNLKSNLDNTLEDSKPSANPSEGEGNVKCQHINEIVANSGSGLLGSASHESNDNHMKKITMGEKTDDNEAVSQEELQKMIRTIAANPSMTTEQKNYTIQGLRDSLWQNNRKRKLDGNAVVVSQNTLGTEQQQRSSSSTRDRRVTPPSAYYRKTNSGKVELVWTSETEGGNSLSGPTQVKALIDPSVPLFSASELAPTYHDGATGAVLGCPHYARSCKLRHPSSGRLYTCRLCCQQEREMPLKDQDSPLDRYAVTEVLCMRCGALQPADKSCANPNCESKGKPYSKYQCKICNFYDDSASKLIYHCPYCNVCRSGAGLGIDYRHCMRCNACVSLQDDEHVCIPQRLQGNCPICHDVLFQSTEPLRGLKCGHVMHLSCFTSYMRGQTYTCPLCKKSIEDMSDYFSLLDAAVRMQPMPIAYSRTISQIYCQDCCETGAVPYHFVGCKCQHCGSYNTRELQRFVEQNT